MRVIYPQGMVERLSDRHRRPRAWPRYGRSKDGGGETAESLKIAAEKDRRNQPRDEVDPLRGRLIDLST